MDAITVKELATLKGCTERNIQKLIQKGSLPLCVQYNKNNRVKYLIPVSSLSEPIQKAYYLQKKQNISISNAVTSKKAVATPLDCLTEDERNEIATWIDIINKWQEYRSEPNGKSKAEIDKLFVSAIKLDYPTLSISTATLYRKWKAYRDNDTEGMIDKRNKWKKGGTAMDQRLWDAFLYYYLDEAQHPISKCYEYMTLYAGEMFPELIPDMPKYHAFYRRLESEVPEPVRILGREGEKAYRDRCAPYIRREYDLMVSNEWWVADTHTFDVQTLSREGKIHRLYFVAIMDVRSGIIVGYHITESPNSQSVLIALRKAILKYGIPENFYVDNGREFLTFDIGGLGHRTKKPKDGKERFAPPPIFKRLGIKMTNAIVRNARAKVIERRFLDVKNDISRLFETYTGGNILERPEKLKKVLKRGEIIADNEFIENINLLIEYSFNFQPYSGAVDKDKGKSRIEVYNEYLQIKRTASNDDLNLLLMRSTRSQTVKKRGVYLKINGLQLDYWNKEFVNLMFGREVYLRYDPDYLSEVRVYGLDDRFIMTVPTDNEAIAKYGGGKEEIKAAQQKVKRAEKDVKAAVAAHRTLAFGKRTAFELEISKAHRNKDAGMTAETRPGVIELRRCVEDPLLRASGDSDDLDIMIMNALRNKEVNNE